MRKTIPPSSSLTLEATSLAKPKEALKKVESACIKCIQKNKVGYCNIQAEKPTLYYIPNYIPKLKSFLLTFLQKSKLLGAEGDYRVFSCGYPGGDKTCN